MLGYSKGSVQVIGTFHQPPALLPELVRRSSISPLDLVLVMSPSQEPFFRNWLPADRVRTFLHGVDTTFFTPAPRANTGSTFRCLTVGHWLRDWPVLREVVKRCAGQRDLEFHVVTGRQTGLEDQNNVVTHRGITDDDLRGLYQSADALILPLTDSTANNSLLEGMACGLPVVSTQMVSVATYTGEGSSVLIEDNAPDAIVSAIEMLRDDPKRRASLGAAARARAEQLSWSKRATELVEIYRDLSGRPRS